MRHRRSPHLAPLLILALATPIVAQEPASPASLPDHGVVVGRVLDRDTRESVDGAFVQLRDTEHRMFTDSLGWFAFPSVAEGDYLLEVQHIGYGTQGDSLRVPAQRTVEVTFRVSQRAIELDPIEVRVLSDLERRRRALVHPHHMLIGREDIERYSLRGAFDIGDVLRLHNPNAVRITHTAFPYSVCIQASRALSRPTLSSGSSGCRSVMAVLDGMPGALLAHEIGDIPLHDIEELEFLPPTEAILRYGLHMGQNGAVLITTRMGARPVERRSGQAIATELRQRLESAERHPHVRHLAVGGVIGAFGGVATEIGGKLRPHCNVKTCPFRWQTIALGVAVGAIGGEILYRLRRREAEPR